MRTVLHHRRCITAILLAAFLVTVSNGATDEGTRWGAHDDPGRFVAVLGSTSTLGEMESGGARGERPRAVQLGGCCGVLPADPQDSPAALAATRQDAATSIAGRRCPWARRMGNADQDADPFLHS